MLIGVRKELMANFDIIINSLVLINTEMQYPIFFLYSNEKKKRKFSASWTNYRNKSKNIIVTGDFITCAEKEGDAIDIDDKSPRNSRDIIENAEGKKSIKWDVNSKCLFKRWWIGKFHIHRTRWNCNKLYNSKW